MKIKYNNLYTHFIFTIQNRQALIKENARERIEKYITGIISNYSSKLYAIYANPEHMHFLISRSPAISEEKIASMVAEGSERFIEDNRLSRAPFKWQRMASAFSVSKSDVDNVCRYIHNQPQHHKKESFEEEYQRFLRFYQKTLKVDQLNE